MIDVSGEPQFMENMFLNYHDEGERETNKQRKKREEVLKWNEILKQTSHVVFPFYLFLSAMISNSTIISACAFDSGWKKRNDMIWEEELFILSYLSHLI